MTLKMTKTSLMILAWICLANLSYAEHQYSFKNKFQRQRQQVQQEMPYPAAGYRPGRQFVLPHEQPENENESNFANAADGIQQRRPELTYGAPSSALAPAAPATRGQPSRFIQEQEQEQQFFLTSQRRYAAPAAPVKPNQSSRFVQEQEQQQQSFLALQRRYAAPAKPEQSSRFVQEQEQQQQSFLAPQRRYEAPEKPEQSSRFVQEQNQQQQFFLAPQRRYAAPAQRSKSERLTAAAPKSARFTDNSEAMPDDDDDVDDGQEIESDIDIDVKKQTESGAAVPNPQTSTVYYPAGAVSFVQPFPGAVFVPTAQAQPAATPAYVQPSQYNNVQIQSMVANSPAGVPEQPTVAKSTKLIAQPAPSTTMTIAPAPFYASPAAYTASPSFFSGSPLQYSNFQVQSVAAGSPNVVDQTAAVKFQAQPMRTAKLTAEPAAAPSPAMAVATSPLAAAAAPFYTLPAAYTATPSFFSGSPIAAATSAAYTQPLAQPQFYVSAPATTSAQLQAW